MSPLFWRRLTQRHVFLTLNPNSFCYNHHPGHCYVLFWFETCEFSVSLSSHKKCVGKGKFFFHCICKHNMYCCFFISNCFLAKHLKQWMECHDFCVWISSVYHLSAWKICFMGCLFYFDLMKCNNERRFLFYSLMLKITISLWCLMLKTFEKRCLWASFLSLFASLLSGVFAQTANANGSVFRYQKAYMQNFPDSVWILVQD